MDGASGEAETDGERGKDDVLARRCVMEAPLFRRPQLRADNADVLFDVAPIHEPAAPRTAIPDITRRPAVCRANSKK
ncbi:hypothetical protein [Burkholderia vietnamiensis]|uniref:hypothetical protein n=1 Tax=Burkholderia vietnamiensis TaxID=60552 RepID=UPI00075976B2|nr:hypothetical protein [Burkholderia vietnamiensis]